MPKEVLRVALIGYGLAGETFHGPLLEATRGYELAAVVTGDPGRAARAAQNHPSARVLTSADDLWRNSDDIDVVVIASPNAQHAEQGIEALNRRHAVVVDKPIAGSIGDAEKLLEVAAETDGFLTVFQNRRWDSDFLTVRDVIESERLGAIRRFESRFELWKPIATEEWRDDPTEGAGGGVLFDLGAHLVDQAVLLFGPASSVYCEQFRARAGSRVDDDTFLALHHDSGVISHLWMSKAAAHLGPRFRVLGARGAFSKQGLDPQEAQSQRGLKPESAEWGIETADTWGQLSDGMQTVSVPSRLGGYRDFYIQLREALLSGGQPPVDPKDSLYTLQLMVAAGVSATNGRTIKLDAQGRIRNAD